MSAERAAERIMDAIDRGEVGEAADIERIVEQEMETLRVQRDMSDELAATLQAGREKDTFSFLAAASMTGTIFRRCNAVTAPGLLDIYDDRNHIATLTHEIADLRKRLREAYDCILNGPILPDKWFEDARQWLTEDMADEYDEAEHQNRTEKEGG